MNGRGERLSRTTSAFYPDLSGAIGQYYRAGEFITIATTLPWTTAGDMLFNPVEWSFKYLKTLSEVGRWVKKPEWTTPYEIKKELLQGNLLNFSDERSSKGFRVGILPPIAGHSAVVADHAYEQSLVEAALQSGASVYVAEWLSATYSRRNESIDDLVRATHEFVEEICPGDQKLTLIGLCQGGWQSAVYTSLYSEKVNHLVLAGSPIDFKAGNGEIERLAKTLPMNFYEDLVRLGGGNMPGIFMLMGWKGLHLFDRLFKDPKDLYDHLGDEKFMERFRQFRGWYEWTQDIPGAMYLQVVEELFKNNKLIKGELEVLGQKVDLSRITCPVTLVAGDKDDITLPEQVFNAEHYVSSKDIKKITVPAGHIGIFMGRNVIRDYWPAIFDRSRMISLEEARQRKAAKTVYEQDKELAGVA